VNGGNTWCQLGINIACGGLETSQFALASLIVWDSLLSYSDMKLVSDNMNRLIFAPTEAPTPNPTAIPTIVPTANPTMVPSSSVPSSSKPSSSAPSSSEPSSSAPSSQPSSSMPSSSEPSSSVPSSSEPSSSVPSSSKPSSSAPSSYPTKKPTPSPTAAPTHQAYYVQTVDGVFECYRPENISNMQFLPCIPTDPSYAPLAKQH
jgi:hypothetical protein